MTTSMETRHRTRAVVAVIILLPRAESIAAAIFLTNGSGHLRTRMHHLVEKDELAQMIATEGRKEAIAELVQRVREAFPSLTGPWAASVFVSQSAKKQKPRSFRLMAPVVYSQPQGDN